MSTHQVRHRYPVIPFDIAESELCHELEAYFEAIHSYPDRFAKTGVSFHEHLLNVICASHESRNSEPEGLKSAS